MIFCVSALTANR